MQVVENSDKSHFSQTTKKVREKFFVIHTGEFPEQFSFILGAGTAELLPDRISAPVSSVLASVHTGYSHVVTNIGTRNFRLTVYQLITFIKANKTSFLIIP